jgi:hypothetical protein
MKKRKVLLKRGPGESFQVFSETFQHFSSTATMPLHVGVLLAAAVAMSCVCKTTEAHAALPLHEGLQNDVGTTRMHVHSLAMLVSQNYTAPPGQCTTHILINAFLHLAWGAARSAPASW